MKITATCGKLLGGEVVGILKETGLPEKEEEKGGKRKGKQEVFSKHHVKRCVKCKTPLVDDMRLGIFDAGDRVIYCPNENCSRFGLQTWVWVEAGKEEK